MTLSLITITEAKAYERCRFPHFPTRPPWLRPPYVRSRSASPRHLKLRRLCEGTFNGCEPSRLHVATLGRRQGS